MVVLPIGTIPPIRLLFCAGCATILHMPDKKLTLHEAVAITGYDAEYLRRLLRSGKVKAEKLARDWRIDAKSLQAYRNTHPGPEQKQHKAS